MLTGCDEFHWGPNCTNQCACGVGADRCDPVQGCVCKSGWSGDKCESDKNECLTESVCTLDNEICVNTPGAYECACAAGYSRDAANNCVGKKIIFLLLFK